MKIWIVLNGVQQGPYSMDQLRLMPVGPDTPVWYEGLPEWVPASQAPALALWFGGKPCEPVPSADGAAPAPDLGVRPRKPRTYMVWCILLTVLCLSPFGLAGIITGSMATSRYDEGRYEQAQRMSEATEWLLILAIVFAIIGLPLTLALSLL